MKNLILNFEIWMLKSILRKTVKQGGHRARITALYRMIYGASLDEFTEDNKATIKFMLIELQLNAMNTK